MEQLISFVLTLAAGTAAGWLFNKMKVPGGMMVGSIIGVAALGICTGMAYMPVAGKIAAQTAAGAFIACSVDREDLIRMRHILKPAAIVLAGMLTLNLFAGFVTYALSPLDMMTSLMSAVPGGMSDVPIIAADMGADAPKVAVLQFVRMMAALGIFPSVIRWICTRVEGQKAPLPQEEAPAGPPPRPVYPESFPLTLGVAALCGVLGMLSGIPAGALLFSMAGIIVLKLAVGKAYIPFWMKRLAQMLAGAYIGCSIGYEDVLELRFLVLPAVFMVLTYFIGCMATGLLLHKFCGFSLGEAMLAATPAGASDMALIASDMGIESADIAVIQVLRLIFVLSVAPQAIRLVVTLAGGF